MTFPLPPSYADKTVEQYLHNLAECYLDPFVQTLAAHTHILNFFLTTPDLFEQVLVDSGRSDWIAFFDGNDVEAVLDYLVYNDEANLDIPQSLRTFMQLIASLSIPRTLERESGLQRELQSGTLKHTLSNKNLVLGMSPKKLHECEYLSPAISHLCASVGTNNVIDLGSGKGYLSRTLAYQYECSVVALESVGSRKDGAERLDSQLKKSHPSSSGVLHVEKTVDGPDLSDIIRLTGLDNEKVVLAGLHTCGNLAHHALRSLVHTPEIAAVAVVGCCYNLMTENDTDDSQTGYPMSSTVGSYSIPLPIKARMMACQAPSTWTRESRQAFLTRHFYRALLQRILYDSNVTEQIIIGSLRKQHYGSFPAYCQAACKRHSLIDITPSVAQEYYDKYRHKESRVSILWTLMACTVAPLTEAIIHLDRYFYLLENGANPHVSVIFDQAISARNLLVVGVK